MATVDPKELDTMPVKQAEGENPDEFPPKRSGICTYLQPKWATKIMKNRPCFFGTFVILQYLVEMCAYIASANFYSDADRLIPCSYKGDLSTSEQASAFFDLPILLLGIFHVTSWLRTAVLFCVVCLGINLMQVWYFTTFITVFGLAAYYVALMTYYSDDGELCAESQPFRAQYLVAEICSCWFFIIINFLPLAICCMSKEQHDKDIRRPDDSDEEDDDEEGDDKDKKDDPDKAD